jgi:hypothetical protein
MRHFQDELKKFSFDRVCAAGCCGETFARGEKAKRHFDRGAGRGRIWAAVQRAPLTRLGFDGRTRLPGLYGSKLRLRREHP